MRIAFALISAALLALTGCDSTNRPASNTNKPGTTTPSSATPNTTSPSTTTPRTTTPSTTTTTTTTTDTTPDPSSPADNTDKNKRDRDASAKTPIDQNENQADIDITSKIRQEILDQDGMSVNARNVKVITADGKVTLRGPVDSADEQKKITEIAKKVAGDDKVDDHIEVVENKDNK